jgi:hypothetical protein
MFRLTKLALAAALMGAALAPAARAGMIPTAVSVTPDGNNFRWTYGVVVTTDVQVNPGDSFTIYDFGGLKDTQSIVMPVGWTVSVANAGPARFGTNPADDPNIPNLTFTYNGTDPLPGQQGLGNFWAMSSMGEHATSQFTSSTHRQVDGRLENNITTTDVPAPSNDVHSTPEPTTLALLGAGLPLLGLARVLRLRRKK